MTKWRRNVMIVSTITSVIFGIFFGYRFYSMINRRVVIQSNNKSSSYYSHQRWASTESKVKGEKLYVLHSFYPWPFSRPVKPLIVDNWEYRGNGVTLLGVFERGELVSAFGSIDLGDQGVEYFKLDGEGYHDTSMVNKLSVSGNDTKGNEYKFMFKKIMINSSSISSSAIDTFLRDIDD